jgi:predicted Zn-dependent protease with MMP-like domain/DnaJ-domain-containing protein 1
MAQRRPIDEDDRGGGATLDEMSEPDPQEPRPDDYYAILGVSAGASLPEIKRAYHREAKRWHPDRYATAEPALYARAERRMRMLTEAYRALSDPEARAAYDATLRADTTPPEGPGGVSSSIVGGHPGGVARDFTGGDHASRNPNGAGQFFAALAVVVGLALLASVTSGSTNSAPTALVLLVLVIILAVAAILFMADSPASRWATGVMEGEPRGSSVKPPRRRAAPPPDYAFTSPPPGPEDDDAAFKRLVAEALDTVPEEFASYMRNIAVEVEQEPSEETLRASGVPEGYTLLGLYRGVPLHKRGAAEVRPDIITIFRGPIERHCGGDPDRIRDQVRATTLHELAHHFGIEHEGMPEWVK